ncbi:helix-turn-helix domain-containing protein [Actinoallomurus purpureus]|uniref:helix-turn-helix domain-containing protein n=1 Tax=Actinoallomurus purpureus TaxID=478114 RepID=UPI0020921E1A|nr:helix-turn-helix transcriptional regulator [Actinoallomurus purpureus]MCO6007969.1 helix-turn-helix domain-containing protein [Actinoallomurus purpureus]
MPTRESPTLRRRRLAQQLRSLREQAGLKSAEVAARLEWAPSKLTRMERNEGKRPDPRDIRDLCEVYGVDEAQRGYLVQLARDGRKRGWWDPYDKMLPEATTAFIGLEAEASSVLVFEPLTVPGLLQTEDYARAVIGGGTTKLSDEQVQARVDVRMRRQQALYEDPVLEVIAVLDEAVLHREVGGPEVMRAQFEHLRQVAGLPSVTVQVVPFGAGSHAGMSGSFNILQFPEPGDLDAVFVDLVAGEMFIEESSEVKRYHAAFLNLVGAAASPANTLDILTKR